MEQISFPLNNCGSLFADDELTLAFFLLYLQCQAPSTRIRTFLETEIFFVRFSLPFKQKHRFRGTENAGFQIRRPEWRFLKTPASRLRVPDGLKRGFLNSMRSYIHTTSMRMLCKGCYRISIVLAFSCGRAKTVQIRHVWTHFFENGILKSRFFKQYLDTRGHPSPDGLALETCF